uniref:Down syndrome cell adhesion molecule-like protein Dscam2 n=1 Tax=Macrostomum lignano TaxID=282301 RepID=A0A1I8FTC1_9PLAT
RQRRQGATLDRGDRAQQADLPSRLLVGLESQFPAGRGVDQRRPYLGIPSHLYLNLTGALHASRDTSSTRASPPVGPALVVERCTQDLVYLTDKIQAPPDFFYIVVTGKDSEGRDFQRYTPTAIRARESAAASGGVSRASGGGSGSGSGSSVDVKVRRKDTVTLTCEVISPRDYEATWYKVSGDPGGARQRIQSASSQANQRVQTYQLRNVGVVAAGVYELVALTNSGQNHSDKIQVIVLRAHCGRNTTVATGTDAELKCLVVVDEAYDRSVSRRDVGKYICKAEYDGQGSGIRSSRDTWLRIQEAPLSASPAVGSTTSAATPSGDLVEGNAEVLSDMHISARNNVLQILDAKEEHKGVYNCKAENSGGVSAEPVSIVYVERPTVKAVNNSVVGIVGERRQLRCNATGQPVPTVTWRRNGVPIVAGPSSPSTRPPAPLASWLTPGLAGMDLPGRESYPTASVPSTAISIEYGQSGNLPCQASGGHSPNIEWL